MKSYAYPVLLNPAWTHCLIFIKDGFGGMYLMVVIFAGANAEISGEKYSKWDIFTIVPAHKTRAIRL